MSFASMTSGSLCFPLLFLVPDLRPVDPGLAAAPPRSVGVDAEDEILLRPGEATCCWLRIPALPLPRTLLRALGDCWGPGLLCCLAER